jgi:hypothetical protein
MSPADAGYTKHNDNAEQAGHAIALHFYHPSKVPGIRSLGTSCHETID